MNKLQIVKRGITRSAGTLNSLPCNGVVQFKTSSGGYRAKVMLSGCGPGKLQHADGVQDKMSHLSLQAEGGLTM